MWKYKQTKKRLFQGFIVAFFTLFFHPLTAVSVSATVPAPRLKPAPPPMSAFMSEADARQFRSGLSAANARRWSSVNSAIDRINDPVAKDTLRWLQAVNDRNAPTERLEYVHRSLNNCCLLYTSPSPRDGLLSRMPSSA